MYWQQIIAIFSALVKACALAVVAYLVAYISLLFIEDRGTLALLAFVASAFHHMFEDEDDGLPKGLALVVASIYLAIKLLIWCTTDPRATSKAKEKGLAFTSGDSVRLQGLQKKPDLN